MPKPNNDVIAASLQAQVDAQLLEQGAFAPLELLFNSGRLMYSDYESWRRREINVLDDVLMGSRDKIRAELEQAAAYARSIGLVEQGQEFHAWETESNRRPLRTSSDARLHQLIASRYIPAQTAAQMDLFFDNPVVALTNGIVRALSARDLPDAQRQLDMLYTQAPNHADLAAFDQLLTALGHLHQHIPDPRQELDFLLKVTPTARRLLGAQSRDLLAPLWRQLASTPAAQAFSLENPALHCSFALSQAQDWPAVATAVLNEPEWRLHAQLCVRLAESAFHRRRRTEALMAWCHLCWRAPQQTSEAVEKLRVPELSVLWQRFLDAEADASEDSDPTEPALSPADFPAWLLLTEPSLAQHLPADLPARDTPSEERYRLIHRWIGARRADRQAEEIALRKALQASHPALFRMLKQTI